MYILEDCFTQFLFESVQILRLSLVKLSLITFWTRMQVGVFLYCSGPNLLLISMQRERLWSPSRDVELVRYKRLRNDNLEARQLPTARSWSRSICILLKAERITDMLLVEEKINTVSSDRKRYCRLVDITYKSWNNRKGLSEGANNVLWVNKLC